MIRKCVTGCIGTIAPDQPNGPKPPEIALIVHVSLDLTFRKQRSVFVPDNDDEDDDAPNV